MLPFGGEVVVSRLVTFVISLTLLVGVLAQTPEHPSRVREYEMLTLDSRVSHIAVIGDSYTTGTDEGGQGPKSWTARAWQALTRARHSGRRRCGGRGPRRLRRAR